MSENVETAREAIEHAHHAAGHDDGRPRRVAVLIAALAAALALSEMGEKSAQNAYLTHHIQASDDWSFYQAKTIRSNVYTLHAQMLDNLPNAADPALHRQSEAARGQAARLDDDERTLGRKQLMAKAQASEHERDHAFHRYHLFEGVVGALQITIVLASVSVVTRILTLAYAATAIGAAASLFGLAAAFDVL